MLHCAPVSRSKVTVTRSDRMLCAYVSYLPLLYSGNKMLYLCHYRRAGAYRVGRTRRPHCLLLPRRGEIENWVKTELVSWFSWVEFDRKLWSLLRLNSTQLDIQPNVQNHRTCDWTRWVEMSRGLWSQRPIGLNSTSWVELSWVESGRAPWSGLYTLPILGSCSSISVVCMVLTQT